MTNTVLPEWYLRNREAVELRFAESTRAPEPMDLGPLARSPNGRWGIHVYQYRPSCKRHGSMGWRYPPTSADRRPWP